MIYCFLADGFEETEAIAPIDILRRSEAQVITVGVTGKTVTGSHGITLEADCHIDDIALADSLEAVILPGGMPGTLNLENSSAVEEAIDFAYSNGKLICAICAAPQILGHKGLLEGRSATCFPGFENELKGASVSSEAVVTDGRIITAKGAGAAIEFGLAIVSALKGEALAEKIRQTMQCI